MTSKQHWTALRGWFRAECRAQPNEAPHIVAAHMVSYAISIRVAPAWFIRKHARRLTACIWTLDEPAMEIRRYRELCREDRAIAARLFEIPYERSFAREEWRRTCHTHHAPMSLQ